MVRGRTGSGSLLGARHSVLAVAIGALIVLAGCGGLIGGTNPVARERAHHVLERWADAAAAAGPGSPVTPVGELTGQIGDWEVALGDNNKVALMAGMVAAAGGLPRERPPDGLVTWPDGTTASVPLLSQQEAIAAIGLHREGCTDCTRLLATAARLTSGPIETTRGPATAPIWEFAIAGTAVKVTRVALANVVTVDPWFDGNPGIGVAIDSAEGSASGSALTVAFVGGPDAGDQACGEDYSAEAVESDLAVVVIVTRHPHFPPFGGGCLAVGARRTATAALSRPLGERAVLDLQQGIPVPIDLAP
jgi:hypothetical protein